MEKRWAMSSKKSLAKKQQRPRQEAKLYRLAAKILATLKVRGVTLDIFLLPDRKIATLKARFIKKKTEPNVLAFPNPQHFPHPGTKKRHLGEIYLNADILNDEPDRTAPLLLHGLLHLLGYDHKKRVDTKKMEGLESKILKKF
jgi:probable rRNA maturation factor